jgi:hypothetical protein
MLNRSTHSHGSTAEEAKLSALYEQMKEDFAPPAGFQKQLVFQLLDTKVATLEKITDHLKVLRNALRISALGFSGLATVALGLKQEWLPSNAAQSLALILTAGGTFLGSVAALWDVDNYWLRNKVMLSRIRQLRYRLAFEIAATLGSQEQDLKRIFSEIIDTIGDEYWEKTLNRSMEVPMNTQITRTASPVPSASPKQP